MVDAVPNISKAGADFFQMKTVWICSLNHTEDTDNEHCNCNAKSSRELF